jgi:glycine cleavage system H lipoate-binding protein
MVIIFVILTLIIALSIEKIISKQKEPTIESSISDIPVFNKSSIYAPIEYLVSKYHTWAYPVEKVENTGTFGVVKIGIDNFAVKALGNIFIKHIADPGKTVKKGDTIINAEVHGQQINFRSPVSGTIKAINTLLFNKTVKDAYGKDWGLLIEKSGNGENLMSGHQAQNWLKKEMTKLKDFLAESSFAPEAVGVTMYDGGNIVEGILSSLSTKVIPDFEEQFLSGNND